MPIYQHKTSACLLTAFLLCFWDISISQGIELATSPGIYVSASDLDLVNLTDVLKLEVLKRAVIGLQQDNTQLKARVDILDHTLASYEGKPLDALSDWRQFGDFIRKDGWVLVFRATSQLGTSVYDAWTRVGYHDDYIFTRATMPCGCMSINGSQTCDRHYRSRLLDTWPSSAIDKVRVNIYDKGEEKAFVLFSGQGSTYMSWFSPIRLLQSSWPDLKWSSHNYFSIDGYTGAPHNRRFYINHVWPGGCHFDKGWMLVKDTDQSGCPYENADQFPVFLYAAKNSVVTWNSGHPDVRHGDVMAVWVKFRDTVDVDLRQTCMP